MPPSPGHFWESSVTAAPWGQKKQLRAMIQSQMVMGPEAEIGGTMLRLATATTNSSTRSLRPSTRLRPDLWLPNAIVLPNSPPVGCCQIKRGQHSLKKMLPRFVDGLTRQLRK